MIQFNLKLEKSSGLHPNFKIITLFSSLTQNKIYASFVPQSNTVSLLLGHRPGLHLHRWEQVMVLKWHVCQWKTNFNSVSDKYNQTFNSDYFFNLNNHKYGKFKLMHHPHTEDHCSTEMTSAELMSELIFNKGTNMTLIDPKRSIWRYIFDSVMHLITK